MDDTPTVAASDSRGRLSRKTLTYYGLAEMPIQIIIVPLYALIPNYYNSDLGLTTAAVATIWLLARLFDGITDPIVGWLSDHIDTRFGRRRLWMLISIPILMLAIYQLFMPEPPVTNAYLLGWLVALWLGWTFLYIPYYSLGAELSPDYHERTRITGWRAGIGTIANLISKALPVAALFFYGYGGTENTVFMIGAIALIVLPVAISLTVFNVQERENYLPARISLWVGVRILWQNSLFKRLVLAFFINSVGSAAVTVLLAYYIRGVLQDEDHTILTLLVFTGVNLISIPFWIWCSKKISKHRAWTLGLLGFAASQCGYLPLGAGDYYWSLPVTACAGFFGGSGNLLANAMKADVIDVDTLRSKEDRAAWMFAIWSFTTKMAYSLGPWLMLSLLAVVGYEASGSAVASNEDTLPLKLLFVFTPVVTHTLAAALVWNYPMTPERHAALREELHTATGR